MRLILTGLTLLGLTAIAVWLAQYPGLITFQWLGYSIELNPVLFCFGLIFCFLVFIGIFQIFSFIWNIPKRFSEYRQDRKVQVGLKALTKALVALAAGDGRLAMRYAASAKSNIPNSPLSDFFTAKASELTGNEDEAKAYLQELSNHPETSLIGIKGLIAYAQKEQNTSLIRSLALRAYRIKEDTQWALQILFEYAVSSKNWPDAFQYTQKMVNYHFWTPEESTRKKAILNLAQGLELKKDGKLSLGLDHVQRAYKLLPDAFETNFTLASFFLEMGEPKKARKLILRAWVHVPHPDLGNLFLKSIEQKTDSEKMVASEELVTTYPDHAASLLFMARIYMNAKIWGKARYNLEKLIQKEPSKNLYECMAQLEELEYHHHDQANFWLRKANDAPLSEKWICSSCQNIHVSWQPFCSNCSAFDQITYTKAIFPPTLLLIDKSSAPFHIVDIEIDHQK